MKAINARLDVVEGFMRYPDERTLLKEGLEQAGDMERVISKVAVGRVSPRELVQLRDALRAVAPHKSHVHAVGHYGTALYRRTTQPL